MIILDTNVTSELMRSAPSPEVLSWLQSSGRKDLRTTSVTLAELRYGIERLPNGRRKDRLRQAADQIIRSFANDVLVFDVAAAGEYAKVATIREQAGSPIGTFDAQIAAICRVHGADFATRNGKDFEKLGINLINPWEFSQS